MAESVDCTRCGTSNLADVRFCIGCGTPLTVAVTGSTKQLAKPCPSCGTTNPESAQFCAGCGQRLIAKPATPAVRNTHGGAGMYCPICREVALVMADRQGIEVDFCPQCRGVWLDRGELDKIIERVALAQGNSSPGNTERDRPAGEYRGHREHRDYDDDDYRKKKKRRGMLGELFDFD